MDFQQAKVKILRKANRHLPSVHNSVTPTYGSLLDLQIVKQMRMVAVPKLMISPLHIRTGDVPGMFSLVVGLLSRI